MAKVCPACGTGYGDDDLFCPLEGSSLQDAPETDPLLGSVLDERYLVTEKLGVGGMGTVYLAQHIRLPQKWAIKVLHQTLLHDAGAVRRFNTEALSASRIRSDHVVRVIHFGATGDHRLYLVMEYVEGEPLSTTLAREGILSPQRAADIARQTAEALAAAHALGVVHRDLKPDNIMLGRRPDGGDWVTVVDFGIAKIVQGDEPQLTQTGFVIGTPQFMSPEQLSADPVDARSDIYSLALVSFAMLTGQLPFPARTSQAGMVMRLTQRPRTLSEMFGSVAWPSAVQSVIDRGLARDPSARYPTATEFAGDLSAAISAWTMPSGNKAAETAKRQPRVTRPRIAAAGAIALVVVMLGGVLFARNRSDSTVKGAGPNSAPRHQAPPVVSPRLTAAHGSLPASPVARKSSVTMDSAVGRTASASDTVRVEAAGEPEGVSPPLAGADRSSAPKQSPLRTGAAPDSERKTALTSPTAPKPPAQVPADTALEQPHAKDAPRLGRAELDSLRWLVTSVDSSNAQSLLGRIQRDLALFATGEDSVEALVYGIETYMVLDDRMSACKTINAMRDEARRSRFANRVQFYADTLLCK